MPKIVVSYRRSDSSATAGRIYDHLLSHFGDGSVFMDVDHIPFGTDFRSHIRSELLASDILVAVIGPRWLGAGPDGKSRIEDVADPVRVEVETALRHGITIVPVLIDGTPMPAASQLPEALHDLAFLNAAPVDMGRDFRAHMERLSRSLDEIVARRHATAPVPGSRPEPASRTAAPSAERPGRSLRPMLAGVAAIVVATGLGTVGWLEWGKSRAGPSPPARTATGPEPAPRSTEPVRQVATPPSIATEPPRDKPTSPAPIATGGSPPASRGKAHGTFAWYELWTINAPAAQRFYAAVIGWDPRSAGQGDAAYTTFLAGSVPVAGLATLPPSTVAQGARPGWVGYVTVGDVDGSTAEARALGGTAYRAPSDVPGIGRAALVADPQGAPVVLFKGLVDPAPAPTQPAAIGHAGWRELQATDREAAFAFYATLFGWIKVEAPDVAAAGSQLFAAGSDPLGGITGKPASVPVPFWTFYFQVDGLAAAAERVQVNGGTIVGVPHQLRGGAWTVQALDPQGAVFALMSAKR